MRKLIEKRSKILIKTYCFESGLWYLAKSLGDKLIREGHSVIYIPKARYIDNGGMFRRGYQEPLNKAEFATEPIKAFSDHISVYDQIHSVVESFGADYIISFETLIEMSRWIPIIKGKTGVKIIDVPMIEWVTKRFLPDGYKMFDEVWTLTDVSRDLFSCCKNVRRVDWDFVDRELFYKEEHNIGTTVKFYHAASLNTEHSTKNTDIILQAFDKFIGNVSPDTELILTGNIKGYGNLKIIERHANIKLLDEVLSRKKIAKLYQNTDCIIAPSSREGLGLSFFESEACGCKLITTDSPPMNSHLTPYLCKPIGFKKDKSLIPSAILEQEEIYKQIIKAYEDIKCRI